MRYSKSKEIHEIVKRLLNESDFKVKSKGAHVKLWSETLRVMLVVPNTPSDSRAVLNFSADVRSLGFCQRR